MPKTLVSFLRCRVDHCPVFSPVRLKRAKTQQALMAADILWDARW